jgi:prepilin peptidase CpaA
MAMMAAAALATMLVVAAWTDARTRRIPNALVLAGVVAGLCIGFASGGTDGLMSAVGGLMLGLCVLLPAYAVGALGAGDVKLVAAVGAFVGPRGLLGALVLTVLVGGVMALIVAIRAHAVGQLARNLKLIVIGGVVDLALRKVPTAAAPIRSVGHLPYAVAIASGTTLWMLLTAIGRGG